MFRNWDKTEAEPVLKGMEEKIHKNQPKKENLLEIILGTSYELEFIDEMLNGMTVEIDRTFEVVSPIDVGGEAKKIPNEANLVIEQKIKENFSEIFFTEKPLLGKLE